MPRGAKKVFQTRLADYFTSAKEELGTIRQEGNNWYKYVALRNITATVAVVAGDPVSYRADRYDQNEVVSDQSDADATTPIGAGVACGACPGVAGTIYYLWIQIKGAAVIPTALAGSPAAGQDLSMVGGTTDKTLTLKTAAGTPRVAIAQDVANKQVILDCPF